MTPLAGRGSAAAAAVVLIVRGVREYHGKSRRMR